MVLPAFAVELNEVILFKKTNIDLNNPDDFVSLTELFQTYKSFVESIITVRDWLVREIELEKEQP